MRVVPPETNSDIKEQDKLPTIEQDVIDSVPKVFKDKAAQLLKKLSSENSAFRWNEKGELVVDDQNIKRITHYRPGE